MTTSIVWFRNDLRIRDNAVLSKAIAESDQIIPIYIFDTERWSDLDLGFRKTGPFQTMFLLESVSDLQQNLQSLGSDLIVESGNPSSVLSDIAKKYDAAKVYASKEVTWEEVNQERSVQEALEMRNASLELIWQSTLYHLDDLIQPIDQLPDVFTSFRKKFSKHFFFWFYEFRRTKIKNKTDVRFTCPSLKTI